MLDAKERDAVKAAVLAAYKETYPDWTNIRTTEIVENAYFGTIVAVASDDNPDGEICVHTPTGIVMFDTTPELVRWLDMKASRVVSLRDWLAAAVIVVTLILFVAVVLIYQKPEAIGLVVTAMAGILGTCAGVQIKK
jgi:hypothetical protein